MTETDWRDLMVGDRMAVDREFSGRVAESNFSSQEWGLIMTATEFRVVDADDPERARLVADTSKVEQVVPELETLNRRMGAMGPGSGGGESSSGIVGSVKEALGMGDDDGRDTEDVVRRADQLTGEYAKLLQDRLENEGKWERIRSVAAGDAGADERGETADEDGDG